MKIKIWLIYFFAFNSYVGLAQAPNFLWAKRIGGAASESDNSIATDTLGNVYTTGYFSGTVDFNPGSGTFNLSSLSGNRSSFITKFDNLGNFIWVKAFGAMGSGCSSIAVDDLGNIYTTGSFYATSDFDPGPGVFSLSAGGAGGHFDIFILKLDSEGNFIWAKAFVGSTNYNSQGNSISIDTIGNVYTTGYFYDTHDFDPGAGIFNLTSYGGADIFISKLDSMGNFVWAKSIGGSNSDKGMSIGIDVSFNIYTTGVFEDSVDFDPNNSNFILNTAGSSDIFILKLDNSGHFLWARAMGGFGDDGGSALTLDAYGSVFCTGYFYGTADFDPGPGAFNLISPGYHDIFISRLDASGNFVWAKRMGGISNDFANSIVLDKLSNVYTTGYFNGTADFDPGSAIYNLTTVGGFKGFVSKLDSMGNFVWANELYGVGNNYANDLALDTYNDVFVTGYFQNSFMNLGSDTLINAGLYDIFITKLGSINTGIQSKEKNCSLGLYPNPTCSNVTVSSIDSPIQQIEIYNLFGEKVYIQTPNETNSKQEIINCLQFSNGIYFVHVSNNNNTYIQKLVVCK